MMAEWMEGWKEGRILCLIYGCFSAKMAELNSRRLQSLKYLLSVPLLKKFADL